MEQVGYYSFYSLDNKTNIIMGYRNTSRSAGSIKGYPKLYFIETDFKVYGPWISAPKSRFKNDFLKQGIDAYLVKFEYNPELGVYHKEYLDIQLTEKDVR